MLRSILGIVVSVALPAWPPVVSAQTVEVDHVFVFVEPGAPEAQLLRDAGFLVDPNPSYHTGQGTASLGVMFRNAYLELIWVHQASEFDSLGFGFPERRATREGSPFGIGLRRVRVDQALPFPTVPYVGEWMGGAEPIQFAEWTGSLMEPGIFVLPESLRWDAVVEQVPQVAHLTEHDVGVQELTAVEMVGPGLPTLSPAVQVLQEWGIVNFGEATSHLMRLTLDAGEQGQTIDLRPVMPLVLHY